jgi:hypothetical protein
MAVTKIYTLSDPFTDKVRYVGRTKEPKARLNGHIRESKKSNKTRKQRWIKSVLKKGGTPIMHIIDEIESEKYQELEMFYISFFKQLGFDLTNSTEGGDGSIGCPSSEKQKNKLKEIMVGNNYAAGNTNLRKGVSTTIDGVVFNFDSVTHASIELNISRRAISNNINGWSNYTHGLKFYKTCQ